MNIRNYWVVFLLLLSSLMVVNTINAAPQMPARIGGSLTVDGVTVTQSTASGYTISVTRSDGTAYNPSADDTDGLNGFDSYMIDIPIYDENDQPGGAVSGEFAVLHVFLDGKEINVTTPLNGKITVADYGTTTVLDIEADIPKPDISVTDQSAPVDDLDMKFGTITTNTGLDKIITIKNDGNAELIMGNLGVADTLDTPFSLVSNNCNGSTLLPSDTCTVSVRCEPLAVGAYTDSLDIPSNDHDESSLTMQVSCTGTPPVPDIDVTDAIGGANDHNMPFAKLREGLSLKRAVHILNRGESDLVIGEIGLAGALAGAFSIDTDNCSEQTISVGAGCILNITFSPPVGDFSGTLIIPSNDPDEETITITLSGLGVGSKDNNPPAMPKLLYPADGEQGVNTAPQFKWEESSDPDRQKVTYTLYCGRDINFVGAETTVIASITEFQTMFAWNSAGVLFFGATAIGGIRSRRKMRTLLLTLAIVSVVMTACGGGGGGGGTTPSGGSQLNPQDQDVTVSTDLTQTVSGLISGTTYYWKVVADDGNGGVVESDVRSFKTL